MTDPTETRLSALEFLVRGLWAYVLVNLPEDDAKVLASAIVERSKVWERGEGAPLREVSEVQTEAALTAAWVDHLIADALKVAKAWRELPAKDKGRP